MWQPTASNLHLQIRAQLLAQTREFFAKKQVLEVETPLLASHGVTDLHLHAFATLLQPAQTTYYLQTSPEYAMKRLLCAGMGSIYQICKAFRNQEIGRKHNPEFTLVEWYRMDFDHHQLMNEVDELLQTLLSSLPAEKKSYQALFSEKLKFDPWEISFSQLRELTQALVPNFYGELTDKTTCLELLMTHLIEPELGFNQPIMIYDYPPEQAALAKIRRENHHEYAERFEVYIQGIELANGFHELSDHQEQQQRFQQDIALREQAGLPSLAIDPYFIQALKQGLPPCAGVALGFDRLLMIKLQTRDIAEVMSFTIKRM
ncbi:MAG: elongation factor P--(R)-beta-lysine ligase [Legionellales bacterium]|nr:elongation factor P--(R)-beta-lysine ligase [Legionellales bacterium]